MLWGSSSVSISTVKSSDGNRWQSLPAFSNSDDDWERALTAATSLAHFTFHHFHFILSPFARTRRSSLVAYQVRWSALALEDSNSIFLPLKLSQFVFALFVFENSFNYFCCCYCCCCWYRTDVLFSAKLYIAVLSACWMALDTEKESGNNTVHNTGTSSEHLKTRQQRQERKRKGKGEFLIRKV